VLQPSFNIGVQRAEVHHLATDRVKHPLVQEGEPRLLELLAVRLAHPFFEHQFLEHVI
jgi:hypothetical protein